MGCHDVLTTVVVGRRGHTVASCCPASAGPKRSLHCGSAMAPALCGGVIINRGCDYTDT